ncbi:MXAN_5187 C-terminal domain-containing protein [Myxococcus sp. MxC21-1]|uniref:MXAN_5187 C-terminal domain-containing protein n=1 Tax=Myxococcus sp. MxC21-1 TaxID=3041439 RepID=UPI002930078F|nr:MXAN_5187 C-terminal domain-containing protein [Myxococcus sp. MxC21-1]WNZ62662.1 MXAN_5187 C-terminal domain-containing protein [Myxococcus sp. MxC21-1]
MPPPDARQSGSKSFAGRSTPADPGSSEAVLQECEALEAEVAVLRNLYEQYFLGNERQAPSRAHEDLKKRMNKLKGAFIRSTSAKFRVAGLYNKFLTYERLWARTLQEIEAGTYRRDVFKARRRAEGRKAGATGAAGQKGVVELPEDISDMDFEEVEELIRPRPVNEPQVAASFLQATGGTPSKGPPAVAPLTPAIAPVMPAVGSTPLRGTLRCAADGDSLRGARGGDTAARSAHRVVRGGGTPAHGTSVAPPGMAAKAPGAVASTPPPSRPVAAGAGSMAPPSRAPGTGAAGSIPPPSRPASTPPSSAASRPPSASGGGGLADDKLRAVYDAYVTAKRRCQEDTSKLSYESVAATLRKQVPELLKQHNAKAVEFKVVIKDGKASLKAVPK